jgi:hypothetical protein
MIVPVNLGCMHMQCVLALMLVFCSGGPRGGCACLAPSCGTYARGYCQDLISHDSSRRKAWKNYILW